MPRTTMQHSENWTLVIERAEGDDWPVMRPYSSASYEMQPDRITVSISRDTSQLNPWVTYRISGLRLKKDGTPGSLRVNSRAHASWAAELVQAARSRHNLTEEALERGDG